MNFAPGAWKYAIPALLAAPFALLFSATASLLALAVGAGTLAFFRDPDRTPPPTGVVSPADGNVSVLREEGDRVRVGVFMNVWHVHVVRAPFEASVTDVEHVSGANRPAFSKESDRNERVHVRCETSSPNLQEPNRPVEAAPGEGSEGTDSSTSNHAASDPDRAAVGGSTGNGESTEGGETEDPHSRPDEPPSDAEVTLIAGAFARRIHPYVEPGDELDRGERIGHIAFGSRVDVLFPPEVALEDIAVEKGDSMTAGETVLLEGSVGGEIDLGIGSDVDGGFEGESGESHA